MLADGGLGLVSQQQAAQPTSRVGQGRGNGVMAIQPDGALGRVRGGARRVILARPERLRLGARRLIVAVRARLEPAAGPSVTGTVPGPAMRAFPAAGRRA